MYQYDDPTCVSALPAPAAAGTPGYFTNGNPASAQAATILTADFMNAVMMELLNVVTGAGITPTKGTNNQVLAAIKRICQNTTVLTDTGAANAYTATNAVPLVAGATPTWIDGVVQVVKIAHTNTGASTYAPDGLTAIPIYGLGLQPLQGGELVAGGTAILMHATITGVNSGNPICVLMECAGGAQQVPPATQPQHAVQLGQISGVVGSVRNLVMNVATANASATLTADEIIVESALGGLRYCLANFNQGINLATTGASGMDTGTAPASGYVALYAIYNPTIKAAALLATNATNAVAPNVYGGANMPSGYTASALLAVWPTNVGSQFVAGWQNDRVFAYNSFVTVLNNSTVQGSPAALLIAGAVPKNAKTAAGNMNISTTAGSFGLGNISLFTSGSSGTFIAFVTAITAGIYGEIPFNGLPLITAQTMYYASTGSATPTFAINISGYTI